MIGNFLQKDINLKILSVIFAIFLWAYVYYKDTPFQENLAITSFVVPLEVKGLASDLVVVEIQDNVFVKVRGNKDVIANLKMENVRSFVDLSNKGVGSYRGVSVHASSIVEVITWEPKSVDVKIDKLVEKVLSENLECEGKLKNGYVIDKEKTVMVPDKVVLKGPEDLMKDVDKIIVRTDISNATCGFNVTEVPMVVDNNDKAITGLTLKPSNIQVFVEIIPDKKYKTVPIVPSIFGTLPEGYIIKYISLQHSTATIEYTSTDERDINYVKTFPIDINGKTEDIVTNVLLRPIEGVNIINNTIRVVIRIGKNTDVEKTPTPVKKDSKNK